MGVRRGGQQGHSLRAVRDQPCRPPKEWGWVLRRQGDGKMELEEAFRMPALWKVRHQTCRYLSASLPSRPSSDLSPSLAGEAESTGRSVRMGKGVL